MSNKTCTKEYLEECAKAYAEGKPLISDAEYDALYASYKADNVDDVPVGAPAVDSIGKVEHKDKMLSLENARTVEDVDAFNAMVCTKGSADGTPFSDMEYVGELKYDGVSLSLVYADGYFVRAVTRGDGVTGNDVTHLFNADVCSMFPMSPEEMGVSKPPAYMEVRGELMMSHEALRKLNARLVAEGGKELKNPRNAVAGSLALKDAAEFNRRGIEFYAYYYSSDRDECAGQRAQSRILSSLGFELPSVKGLSMIVFGNIETMKAQYEKLIAMREGLPFDIDGFVIKVNDMSLQRRLGASDKYPRWAVAWKFPERPSTTKLLSVEFNAGRTGKVTPVAVMEPVDIGGVTVTNATMCNPDELVRLDVHYGDELTVCRGGDVIPKVLSAKPCGGQRGERVVFPECCPACGGKLHKPEGKVDMYCTAGKDCPAQVQAAIEHFVSRDALNIDGVGGALIEKLLDSGKIKHAIELFALTEADILSIDGYRETSARKAIAAIATAKTPSLPKLLVALGIRDIGSVTAEALAVHFGRLDDLAMATEEDFIKVDGVGATAAKSLHNYFWGEEFSYVVMPVMYKCGVRVRPYKPASSDTSKPLHGMVFVVTGKMQKLQREDVVERLMADGATVARSVTKAATHLLYGSNPGSKLDEAKKRGLTLIPVTDDRVKKYVEP